VGSAAVLDSHHARGGVEHRSRARRDAIARLPTWLHARQQVVLTSAVRVVRKRLPWWALLIGAWLAVGYWPLPPQAHLLAVWTIFVLGALSVTFALAAIASESVDTYGSYIAPALPVSSLTRNLAWAIVAVLGLLVVLNPASSSHWPAKSGSATRSSSIPMPLKRTASAPFTRDRPRQAQGRVRWYQFAGGRITATSSAHGLLLAGRPRFRVNNLADETNRAVERCDGGLPRWVRWTS
jgi:hypothetical protein